MTKNDDDPAEYSPDPGNPGNHHEQHFVTREIKHCRSLF
jgi:hypothetical protein